MIIHFHKQYYLLTEEKLQEKTEIKKICYCHSLGGATSSLKTVNQFSQRDDIVISLARWLLHDNQASYTIDLVYRVRQKNCTRLSLQYLCPLHTLN